MDENQESVGKIVCIDGNIGAGKSSILGGIERYGIFCFSCWVSFLDNVYADPKRWAFTFQITVLNGLCNQLSEI